VLRNSIALAFIVIGSAGSYAADYDDIVKRHVASRDSLLENLACRVVCKLHGEAYPGGHKIVWTSDCKYFSNKFRCDALDSQGILHSWYHSDGVLHTLVGKPGAPASQRTYSTKNRESRFMSNYDPASGGLLSLNLPGTIQMYGLEDFVRKSKKSSLRTEPAGTVELECEFAVGQDTNSIIIQFDPARNYLIRSTISDIATPDGRVKIRRTASAFQELKLGLYCPTFGELICEDAAAKMPRTTVEISNIKIGKIGDARGLRVEAPVGSNVVDTEKGTYTKAVAAGQVPPPPRPLLKERPPASAKDAPEEVVSETREDSTGMRTWHFALLGIAIIASCVLLWRRRKGT
jgi:hypothetical protein